MFAIICDARKGKGLGVEVLALVDRARSKRLWWTSDNANIILGYHKRTAAEYAVGRLKKNRARVVSFDTAAQIVRRQAGEIKDNAERRAEKYYDDDPSWDAHKH